jgi:4,5-dihydroxyphthalate decarboxylase
VDTGKLRLKVMPFRDDGERHRRFLAGEFDAAEFSLALLLALKDRGDNPWTVLPVFPNRRFRHSFIYVRDDSQIKQPEDLRGKAVGVPLYLNTCGLWARGLLAEDYGVRPRDVVWKALRPDPRDFAPPADIRIEPLSGKDDLRTRLLRGELAAAITPEALEIKKGEVRRLFPQSKRLEQDYYRRTGVFPISHAIVIRERVVQEFPWVVESLFDAWKVAKRMALEDDEDPTFSSFAWIQELWEEEREVLGADPWRYGIGANEKSIHALLRYGNEQGIVRRELRSESLFCKLEES